MSWLDRDGVEHRKTSALFKLTVAASVGAHAAGFAYQSSASASDGRIVRIPVVLEAEAPPRPPEKPPPPPKKKKKPKARPKPLPKQIERVVEGDGLRAGELVDAEEGDYTDAREEPVAAPEPDPAPVPSPPPKPKIDKVELARQFLTKLRGALGARKTYPFSAERMGITGAVSVAFVIEPNGTFSSVRIRRSSGHQVLDRAALQTVRGMSGQLPRPAGLGSVTLRTSVVLRYSLAD